MRRLILTCAVVLATLCAPSLGGAASMNFVMRKGCPVSISVLPFFDVLPMAGFMPVQVKIDNGSDRARTWDFTFTNGSPMGGSAGMTLARSLSAEAGAIRTYEILVPVPPVSRKSSYYFPSSVTATGYGVEDPSIQLSFTTSSHPTWDLMLVGLSNNIAMRSSGPLEKEFSNTGQKSRSASFCKLDPDFFPSDWRAFSGFGAIWFSDVEWARLSPQQRIAIRLWVAQGGSFFLCSQGTADLSEFGVPGEGGAYGTGSVRPVKWNGREIQADIAAAVIRALGPQLDGQLTDGYSKTWSPKDALGAARVNTVFIILFISTFAGIVGPLNLFRLAPSGRRQRLFWTTPLISISASCLLGVVILFQDGIGGKGSRAALVNLIGRDNLAVITQEQVSRSGVLLSQAFSPPENILIAPITLPKKRQQEGQNYRSEEGLFSGDWFKSRSVQAQLLEEIVPMRGRIEILNAADAAAGQPPVIQSSLSTPLGDLYYEDNAGHFWHAGPVLAGEKLTLRPAEPSFSVDHLMAGLKDRAGARLRAQLDLLRLDKGRFCAVSQNSDGIAMPTLPSIRWRDDLVIYTGAAAPAGEAAR